MPASSRSSGTGDADNVTGVTMGAELQRIGFAGPEKCGRARSRRYFEAHIEQGPILEAAEKPIGIGPGAQGQRWYEITVTGQERMPADADEAAQGRAGRRRAHDRRGQNRHRPRLPALCLRHGGLHPIEPELAATPSPAVFFTVDFRHPDDATLDEMDRELREPARAARASQVEVEVKEFLVFARPPSTKTASRRSSAPPRRRAFRHGHHLRRRPRRRLHGARPRHGDGLRALCRRHQP